MDGSKGGKRAIWYINKSIAGSEFDTYPKKDPMGVLAAAMI